MKGHELVTPIEDPLTDEQLGDIESLARKSAESGGRLKYLAPDVVVRLVTEVRALRAVLRSTRDTITRVSLALDSDSIGQRRAAIEEVLAACDGAAHPASEPLSLDRAVETLIGLGWLQPEGRDWARGLMRRQLDETGNV